MRESYAFPACGAIARMGRGAHATARDGGRNARAAPSVLPVNVKEARRDAMFDKWQIKEHMEVMDSSGAPIGAVDHLEGDIIQLTRKDSSDGRHHFLDVDCVDRIENDRVYLKVGVPLPESLHHKETVVTPEAITADYDGQKSRTAAGGGDAPLFGTSGHGTGMGGSGTA
jgi:hypothetical protein